MKYFRISLLVIAILATIFIAFFIEQWFRCSSFVVFLFLIVFFSFWRKGSDIEDSPYGTIFLLYCFFMTFFSIAIAENGKYTIIRHDDSVELVSTLYPIHHKLGYSEGCFESIDTLTMAVRYDDGKPFKGEIYLLKRDTVEYLYDKHSLIIKGIDIKFYEKDWTGNGALNYCIFTMLDGNRDTVDMQGENINSFNYTPPAYSSYYDVFVTY